MYLLNVGLGELGTWYRCWKVSAVQTDIYRVFEPADLGRSTGGWKRSVGGVAYQAVSLPVSSSMRFFIVIRLGSLK